MFFFLKYNIFNNFLVILCRTFYKRQDFNEVAKELQKEKIKKFHRVNKKIPSDYRFKYNDFLPNPESRFRNPVLEKLMRKDMLERRKVVQIPEFYVGSIIAVTISDPHSPGKTNKFVGICIERINTMLDAKFSVRNVIDNQGVEVSYDLYDPAIQKIEVLKLEKRLDDRLIYLRDALPEYSTIDLNMEPEIHAEGAPVPVNNTIVKMKPFPWFQKWERQNLKGVEEVDQYLNWWRRKQKPLHEAPWEKYDLMKEYRRTISEEEQSQIFSEIFDRINKINDEHKAKAKLAARRTINKPTNIG